MFQMFLHNLTLCIMIVACFIQSEALEDDIGYTGSEREKRDDGEEIETTTENMGTGPPVETGEAVGPSLGQILSKFTMLVMLGYVLGIGWKLIKIYRGEYQAEAPIYLKYK